MDNVFFIKNEVFNRGKQNNTLSKQNNTHSLQVTTVNYKLKLEVNSSTTRSRNIRSYIIRKYTHAASNPLPATMIHYIAMSHVT